MIFLTFWKVKNQGLQKRDQILSEKISKLIEYRYRKKEEIEQSRKEEQQIQKLMFNHQKMLVMTIVIALHYVMKIGMLYQVGFLTATQQHRINELKCMQT
jgi:hypothetical protein